MVQQWLADNHGALQVALKGLSSIKAGAPFDQLFTDIRHDLSGWTNDRLVRACVFVDPQGPYSRFPGFVPMAWTPDIQLMDEGAGGV